MNEELLDQIERILKIYERTQELELRKAEIGAKIANDLLAKNQQNTMNLLAQFQQFITPNTPLALPPKDNE
jgi:hypothetical protein